MNVIESVQKNAPLMAATRRRPRRPHRFVRLARQAAAPIVPVARVGGQETTLFLGREQWLARLLMLDKMLRLTSVPISVAPAMTR